MKNRIGLQSTRRQPRLRAFDLRASCPELSFVVLDFSASGLRIESRDSVQIGRNYGFRFVHDDSPAEVQGEARWCKVHRTLEIGPGEFQTIYRAGFALHGPPRHALPTGLSADLADSEPAPPAPEDRQTESG